MYVQFFVSVCNARTKIFDYEDIHIVTWKLMETSEFGRRSSKCLKVLHLNFWFIQSRYKITKLGLETFVIHFFVSSFTSLSLSNYPPPSPISLLIFLVFIQCFIFRPRFLYFRLWIFISDSKLWRPLLTSPCFVFIFSLSPFLYLIFLIFDFSFFLLSYLWPYQNSFIRDQCSFDLHVGHNFSKQIQFAKYGDRVFQLIRIPFSFCLVSSSIFCYLQTKNNFIFHNDIFPFSVQIVIHENVFTFLNLHILIGSELIPFYVGSTWSQNILALFACTIPTPVETVSNTLPRSFIMLIPSVPQRWLAVLL